MYAQVHATRGDPDRICNIMPQQSHTHDNDDDDVECYERKRCWCGTLVSIPSLSTTHCYPHGRWGRLRIHNEAMSG